MSSDSPKPYYFTYNDYTQVRNKLWRCDSNYNNDEKERFNKIISSITNHNFVNWEDKFFSCLHHYLTYHNGYMGFGVDYYCRYINLWLNREVRKTGYEGYQQHFNIFKDFVHNYADAKQGNYTDSCKEYIYLMDDKEYNRINFLYNFYDMYNNLKSKNYPFTTDECDNLFRNTANYKAVIDDYYKNHRDLYDKISHVKNLIEKIVKEPPKKCDNILNFSIPLQFLEDEKKRKQEEAEKQKQQAEEAERQKQKADEAERERRQREAELEAERRRKPVHTTPDAEGEEFHQGTSLLSLEQESSRETVNLGAPEHSKLLTYRWESDNSGRFEHLKEPGLGQHEGQSEEIIHAPGKEYTSTDGPLSGSFRLPSAITEVFGSVDPVPVVGVSGGMGALFLLFRYTPLGTFFRGGRGRAHRIPRSFNGQFLGAFPDVNEYNGGYIGYGPMDIPYGAE